MEASGSVGAPRIIVATEHSELERSLVGAGLALGRPVVVLIGGASRLDDAASKTLAPFVRDGLMATAQALGAAVVDGGTDAGVMALAGMAHDELRATLPLVGVAPIGCVSGAGIEGASGATKLEPHHTHLLLAPGDAWGDELPWLIDVARAIGSDHPVVAVVVDGGQVAGIEATKAQAEGWPVITLAGSGRTADDLARIARLRPAGEAAPERGGIHVCDVSGGPTALATMLSGLLAPATTTIEFPALFVAASEASRRGQQSFKLLSRGELALVIGGVLLSLWEGFLLAHAQAMGDPLASLVATAMIGAFLLAFVVKVTGRSTGYDDIWYTGRAVAEAVRSESWRYMTRASPYEGDDADERFATAIEGLLARAKDILQAAGRLPERPKQISAEMRLVRGLDLAGRKNSYVTRRLQEQTAWYAQRSARHRGAAARWYWLSIIFQLASAVAAFLALHLFDQQDLSGLFLRGMSACASIAIAATAWTQLNRDKELSRTYAFTYQELAFVTGKTESAPTEEALGAAVRDGEDAIGRENRAWLAMRAEPVESPEFGHAH